MTKEWNPAALRQVFLQEAEEALSAMEQALIALEAAPESAAPLNEVFRLVHTIKGGAGMVDLPAVAEFSHRFEDALSMMRDGSVQVTQGRVTVMLQVVDSLRGMLAAENRGQVPRVRASDQALIARLVPVELQSTGGGTEHTGEFQSGFITDGGVTSGERQRSLRVDMGKLDGMLTLSTEIAVARGRLMQALSLDGVSEASQTAAEDLTRLLTTLHERVMEMRLVPVGPLFRQHQRTVRDVAAAQGKLIRLTLDGEAVEVDATIVERLREPLTHLIRNAVDHGIEHPSKRRDAGKDLTGTIALSARHERGEVIVEIRDDGRGMNRRGILEKASEMGLVRDGAPDQLSDAQVFALVTAPGLSTATQVTELSGRGVGMDAVRRSIEGMRGSLEIESTEGAGTTVRLRLPLTVAIIDGFVIGVSGERYVIPVGAVTECMAAHETDRDAVSGVLSVRGKPLPYVRLRHLFGGTTRPDATARESIVVVQADGQEAGLVVDQVIGETQAVIKPLAGMFNQVRGLSGTTIMGDGCISLILDVAPLLEIAQGSATGARAWRHHELQ
ncbi:MAG TPA: chemotaxis protein CheA [Gemmatimonadaceae bacterium]|nr:chemotaxis protein CheA [Gemmatimonadaceae bacterium]